MRHSVQVPTLRISVYTCGRKRTSCSGKASHVDAITQFFNWLFGTRAGVLALMVGGILLFALIAWRLEKGTRAKFYNHQKTEGDWDLFGEDDE